MKICSPQLGISKNSILGGEIYDYQTLKGFTKNGAEVFIYLPKNRPYDKSLKNFHVEYCFMTHIFPPWIYSFICLPYLLRTYKKEKFDVLRIHSPRFLGMGAIIFHLIHPNVPILASSVTVDPHPIFYPIEWLVYKISKGIIVQSEYMKNLLVKKYGADQSKIAVTYGGQISSEVKSDIPKESNLKTSDKVLLYMGVLVRRKNPIFLISVFKNAKIEIPNLKLVIIGSGPEKDSLVEGLKNAGLLSDAIFVNAAYGPEKAYWLNRMDVFALPSLDEALGLAVTEAMSFAKPTITSNIPVFSEIISNGTDGYTLPLNPKIWAQKIVSLLKSPTLSQKIGKAAKKSVEEKFNWEKTFKLNYEFVKRITQ